MNADYCPKRGDSRQGWTNKAAGGHNQRIRPPVESHKSKVKVGSDTQFNLLTEA
jgi:hypothetical protein